MEIAYPEQFLPLFDTSWRHIGFHGGRGGAKSWSFADALLDICRHIKKRVLCVREIQKTIKDSVHKLLADKIEERGYKEYQITNNSIKNTITGSDFFFTGLHHNSQSVKSIEGVDICWIEEAQAVSMESLDYLIPTIRKDDSQLWYSFNRFVDNDPVWDKVFKNPSDKTYIAKVNIMDLNHRFQSKVLLEEMEIEKLRDYNAYLHIWEGEPLGQDANSAIDRIKVISAMDRHIDNPEGGIVIGADIARFGDDLITFYKRKGFKTIDHKTFKKQDIVKTANDLMDFAGDKSIPINIDDTGVGGGVTDILKNKGYNAIGINFGGKDQLSQEESDKYDNNITKMWMEFASIIDSVDIPNDEDLKTELSTRLYAYTKDQKKIIEPKKDFKKRYGKSPDKADGLLLCYLTPYEQPKAKLWFV